MNEQPVVFSDTELHFLKSLLLDAQWKAEKVLPGPWKQHIANDAARIAALWDKVNQLGDGKCLLPCAT